MAHEIKFDNSGYKFMAINREAHDFCHDYNTINMAKRLSELKDNIGSINNLIKTIIQQEGGGTTCALMKCNIGQEVKITNGKYNKNYGTIDKCMLLKCSVILKNGTKTTLDKKSITPLENINEPSASAPRKQEVSTESNLIRDMLKVDLERIQNPRYSLRYLEDRIYQYNQLLGSHFEYKGTQESFQEIINYIDRNISNINLTITNQDNDFFYNKESLSYDKVHKTKLKEIETIKQNLESRFLYFLTNDNLFKQMNSLSKNINLLPDYYLNYYYDLHLQNSTNIIEIKDGESYSNTVYNSDKKDYTLQIEKLLNDINLYYLGFIRPIEFKSIGARGFKLLIAGAISVGAISFIASGIIVTNRDNVDVILKTLSGFIGIASLG